MRLDEGAIRAITSRSIGLVALLSISYWLFCPSGLIAQTLSVDVSFLMLPIAISSAMFYVSAIIKAIFTSKTMGVASDALKRLAIVLAMYLIAMQWAFDVLASILFWTFVIVLTTIFNRVMASLADLYKEPLLNMSSTALSLFITGLSLSNVLAALLPYIPSLFKALSEATFWAFTIAAVASSLSIFRYSPNPYLRTLSIKIGSNIARMTLLIFSVLMYFLTLRPHIVRLPTPIPVDLIEWGVICFSLWLFYRSLKGQVNKYLAEPLEIGDWAKLVQEIEHVIDTEQVIFADLVKEFIDHGVKDGIIARLVSIMLLNGLNEESIRGVVKKVLEYQDIPYPRIRLAQWIKGIDEENKRRRRDLLKAILAEVGQEIKSTKSPQLLSQTRLLSRTT